MSHWMSLLLLYFHVFSGLSVFLFSVYVQLRQNVPCPTQNGAVPLPASDLLAHTVSTRNNVKDVKNDWSLVSDHPLHFKLHQYSVVLKDTGELLLGASSLTVVGSTSIFLTHAVIAVYPV